MLTMTRSHQTIIQHLGVFSPPAWSLDDCLQQSSEDVLPFNRALIKATQIHCWRFQQTYPLLQTVEIPIFAFRQTYPFWRFQQTHPFLLYNCRKIEVIPPYSGTCPSLPMSPRAMAIGTGHGQPRAMGQNIFIF